MTVRLLRQFLEAGIRPGPALKTLNAAMKLRGESCGGFSTVDLAVMQRHSGTVQLYSDLMYSGMCTTHTTPLEPTPDPDAPDDGSGTTPGGDATTGGDSGTQTPSDNTGTAGDSASGDVGDNGQFLNWLLNNGGTGR